MQNVSGFVAGTLVHTDKGVVSIQDIKVGDMVLSKLDVEVSYTKVINVFEVQDAEVFKIEYLNSPDSESEYLIFSSPESLIWINGDAEGFESTQIGWTKVSDIEPMSEVQLFNSELGCISWATEVFSTNMDKVGFTMDSLLEDAELLIEFNENKNTTYYIGDLFNKVFNESNYPTKAQGTIYVRDGDIFKNSDNEDEESIHFNKHPNVAKFVADILEVGLENLGILRTTVYNLEVEDTHSYFICEQGILVHDATLANVAKDMP